MRGTANPMRRGFESHTYLHHIPSKLASFRADSQGLLLASLGESLARHSFTVRTKELDDVFPRRARLGRLRIITCFA